MGRDNGAIDGGMMREVFWKLLTVLLTSAVLTGVYFVVKDIIYAGDLSIQERMVYYCLFLATIFAGGFLLDRRR